MDHFLTKKQLLERREYDDLDYISAFVKVYNEWIQDRFEIDVSKYPFSYLLKKYNKEFYEEVLGDEYEDEDDIPELDRWGIPRVVERLLEMGKVKLPSMQPETKLTEMFGDVILNYLKRMEIPSYYTIELEEKTPFYINIKGTINFKEMMETPGKRPKISAESIEKQIKKFLTGYMGLEIGNPLHNEVNLDYDNFQFTHYDEWKKNVFDKELRKGIKNLPGGKYLLRMTLSPRATGLDIQLTFGTMVSYLERRNLRDQIKSYLESKGYGPEKIEINFNS